ncbi:Oidioi.mRNA.OKI2018_I69.chr1.g735.t1.cds [Oikopleura dioica]|uniref:Oidioi.mRNA.OKI2018_I69.chr1.g735.t1.cds n=1 Tax=Oikopleura dioica TaxID=34765 RepID=A0ABN7SKS2_OIKDI|nr:Oidioi.mRNA.OKI2018_I69.chr1.g735.t1.cds [Oikopleura dioica]
MEESIALVTGSSGYFGQRLVKALAEEGYVVRCVDLNPPESKLPEKCVFHRANMLSKEEMEPLIKGAEVIFHTASAGMTGSYQLDENLNKKVNVNGTSNILNLSQKHNVKRFIFTSSYNVIFSKKELVNVTEEEPYPDDKDQYDWYSKTKKEAEKMVLAANNEDFRTCALRPNGIYGLEQGVTIFKFGIGTCILDWCHVMNLVEAHICADRKLKEGIDVSCGKAYNISDDAPSDPYVFLFPLFKAMEQPLPQISLPFYLVFFFAYLSEKLTSFLLVAFGFRLEPIVTRNECLKVCLSHYCDITAAKNELGYRPGNYKFSDAVDILMKERKTKRRWSEIINDNRYKFYFAFALALVANYLFKFIYHE